MDLKQVIADGWDWSCGHNVQRPYNAVYGVIRADPQLIGTVRTFIVERGLTGDTLEIFFWWMGVMLGLAPKDLK